MQVKIRRDIYQNEANIEELENLFKYFRTSKHELILDNIDDIDALSESKWFNEMSSKNKSIIERYIVTSTKPNRKRKRIEVSLKDEHNDFSPEEADRYLNQPLSILLENGENDSNFLNAIITHFDPSQELKKAFEDNKIKYVMGGGSTIDGVIRTDLKNHFNHKSFKKDKKKYLRYFVILDSDKLYPEMEIPAKKTEVMIENDIPHYILYKREAENYVPLEILKTLKDVYLDAYVSLPTVEQRDFFDIEKGMYGKTRIKAEKEKKELLYLYGEGNLSDKQWDLLKNGLPYQPYGKTYKSEFQKLFQHPSLTKLMLSNMIFNQPRIDNLNEFEHIVNEIKNQL